MPEKKQSLVLKEGSLPNTFPSQTNFKENQQADWFDDIERQRKEGYLNKNYVYHKCARYFAELEEFFNTMHEKFENGEVDIPQVEKRFWYDYLDPINVSATDDYWPVMKNAEMYEWVKRWNYRPFYYYITHQNETYYLRYCDGRRRYFTDDGENYFYKMREAYILNNSEDTKRWPKMDRQPGDGSFEDWIATKFEAKQKAKEIQKLRQTNVTDMMKAKLKAQKIEEEQKRLAEAPVIAFSEISNLANYAEVQIKPKQEESKNDIDEEVTKKTKKVRFNQKTFNKTKGKSVKSKYFKKKFTKKEFSEDKETTKPKQLENANQEERYDEKQVEELVDQPS